MSFLYVTLLFASEHLFSHFYSETRVSRRLSYIVLEGIASLVTIVIGGYLLGVPDSVLATQEIWQGIMLPPFYINIVFVLAYRKDFNMKIVKFDLIHHGISLAFLILSAILNYTNVVNSSNASPYVLLWNGATFFWVVDFFWYTQHLSKGSPPPPRDQFRMKLFYLISQRVWRTIFLVLIIVMLRDTNLPAVIMYSIMSVLLEVYDVKDQVISTINIYKKIE